MVKYDFVFIKYNIYGNSTLKKKLTYDLYPDQHSCSKLDPYPDPHLLKKLDPDPQKVSANP
jgi:hypothetical protein